MSATGQIQPAFHISKSSNSSGESIGHGLFASRDLSSGEQILWLKRPLVASLDSQYLLDTCANCYIWAQGSSTGTRLYVPEGMKVSKCAGCQRFRYCSKACQKEAWNRGHKYECKVLAHLANKEIPKAVLACMELLSRRKHGLIADEEWELLCRLRTHLDDFKQNGNYSNIELMAMGASQFSSTQNMFNKDFVAAMYARVLTNSLTLITPTLDPLGLILDPTLGTLNHSCDPNAFVMMDGAQTSVRTLRPISKDEEIYIAYIDTSNPFHRRQSSLKARWFFECHCIKCQKGATLNEDKWAINPKSLPRKTQDMADALATHVSSAQEPANYVGESKDEHRTAIIQGRAFSEYEAIQNMQNPEEAVPEIENAMRLCHQSVLWTLHRQPYAALRDELIVNLLSIGKYPIAWAHCAARYKHILPRLYPISFHPVRVVQTWQMAMLAAYIASTPEGIGAPEVNMGLIAMMLVKQVLDTSNFSHGPESTFTRSVKSKGEEMTQEFQRSLGSSPDNEVMNKELEVQRDMLMEMGDWVGS